MRDLDMPLKMSGRELTTKVIFTCNTFKKNKNASNANAEDVGDERCEL